MPILTLDIGVGHVLLLFLNVEKESSAAQASLAKALFISARSVVLLMINALLRSLLAAQVSPVPAMAVVDCASQNHCGDEDIPCNGGQTCCQGFTCDANSYLCKPCILFGATYGENGETVECCPGQYCDTNIYKCV